MSQDNVELAGRAMQALEAQDMETWIACFADEATLFLPRNALEGGGYHGPEGVRQVLVDLFETWERVAFALEGALAIHDHVVLMGRTTNVPKGDAPTVEYESAMLFEVRGGKIVYFKPYQSHQEALEAAGLSEQDGAR